MAPEILRVRGQEPDPAVVLRAVTFLRQGGLLIYPTDTLYALGGCAWNASVVQAVRAAKGRDPGKPLPLVAADLSQARSLVAAWSTDADRLARRFWPGPLTLVLPAAPNLPPEISAGNGGAAVRIPALALTRQLCAGAGPLISTSANRAGQDAPRNCQDAVSAVGGAVSLALDAGAGRRLASTVVDLRGPEPKLLRAGPIGWGEVVDALGPC